MEKVLAGVVLLVCVLLLARMLLSDRLRWRLDAHGYRFMHAMRRFGYATQRFTMRFWGLPSAHRKAAKEAQDAIRRAKSGKAPTGHWDGNVYKPDSFKKPRKPTKPH